MPGTVSRPPSTVPRGSTPGGRSWTASCTASSRFPNFIEAFGFMARAAIVAQRMDHHPEWSNVYGTVVVDLVTHSAGGITENDLTLAGAIDELAG